MVTNKEVKGIRKLAESGKITLQQEQFIMNLVSDPSWNATDAARKAGYKNPGKASQLQLNKPQVLEALSRIVVERRKGEKLTADEVLEYLRVALMFNPLRYFFPSDDGGWLCDDLSSIPDEIGRLIDGFEATSREDPSTGELIHTFKVKLISKSTVLPLAMKHLGLIGHAAPGKLSVGFEEDGQVRVSWDDLYEQRPMDQEDIIEVTIANANNVPSAPDDHVGKLARAKPMDPIQGTPQPPAEPLISAPPGDTLEPKKPKRPKKKVVKRKVTAKKKATKRKTTKKPVSAG